MDNLKNLLENNKGKSLLAIFPHPDDESFVAGGLFQVAKEIGLKTTLVCLTKGERGISSFKIGELRKIKEKEINSAVTILGIDELHLFAYPDAGLRDTKSGWTGDVKKIIEKVNPAIIITFDHSGITGHPDHIATCVDILEIVKALKEKPILLWRVPDNQELKYFRKNEALKFASAANLKLDYGIGKSIKKLKAIYSYKSQMHSFIYRLHLLDWFLFDHWELYYQVDLDKNYNYRFVFSQQ